MINIQLQLTLTDLKELIAMINMVSPNDQISTNAKVMHLNLVAIKRKFAQRLIKHSRKKMNQKIKISLDLNECRSLCDYFTVLGLNSDSGSLENPYYYALFIDIDRTYQLTIEREISAEIWMQQGN